MSEDLYLRFAALLAAALLVPSVTFVMFAVAHKNMPFWRYTGAGLFCVFFASALSAARDVLPATLHVYTGNILVGVGYFLTLRSLRYVYQCSKWQRIDVAILFAYVGSVFLVNAVYSFYEARVVLVSSVIVTYSAMFSFIMYYSNHAPSRIAAVMVIGFSVFNSVFATTRLLAALPGTDATFSLAFWDPVFFVWSIAATFMFALAQFINGNVLIQQEHIQALEETKRRLERERKLANELASSNDEQQNLQKLLLHEFKRPLSALQAALQVNDSKKTPIDPEKVERLRVLTEQASTYLEGIAQYQDIAELFDAPNWSLVTVSEVARDVATKWGVEVKVDNALENQTIQCDPLLLDIAVGNLVENAQKFSRTSAGVSVSIESVGGKLRLDVEDDGPGIPNTEWEQVWQKFYKLDTETKSALTGCGLGLYIVAEVARVHKGHASVVSTQPSVVRLELPLTEKASADD